MADLIAILDSMVENGNYTHAQICAIDSASVFVMLGDYESAHNVLAKNGVEEVI